MTITKYRNFIFDAAQRAFDILVGIGLESFLQIIGHTVVVDYDAATLAEAGAVNTGDSLQQFSFLDGAIKVHNPLNGGVETGK